VPEIFQEKYGTNTISVLSLVKDPDFKHPSGWLSYHRYLDETPDTEIISGGLNEREVEGAAIWRQGHLLHFAFDLSPSDMNETGQALLLNSIAYIVRFAEDRPIAITPSVFNEPNISCRQRRWIEKLIVSGGKRPEPASMNYMMTPETVAVVKDMDGPAYARWFKENELYLTCAPDGKLMVDAAAREFQLPFEKPGFIPKAIELLGVKTNETKARQLLNRYVPQGPANGSVTEWNQWWQENRSRLFFTTSGGYRYYIDPLAKRRGIPSDQLRGPARATSK
jgi:hypothetical protein